MGNLFYKKLIDGLTSIRLMCSQEEYSSLEKEIKEHCEVNKDLPVVAQVEAVMRKYGSLYEFSSKREIIGHLARIEGTLVFFKVITIISLIGGLVALIAMAA